MTIIHCTTAHARTDTRIRVKECVALAAAYAGATELYVQDGAGDEPRGRDGVSVVDTGPRPRSRKRRMTWGVWRMYSVIRRSRPDVVHFHDPELVPLGLALKLAGVKVVYDVHEDLPRQVLHKHWVRPFLRRTISCSAEVMEWIAGRAFDGIVVATPTIGRRFPASKTVTVQNFPILAELIAPEPVRYANRPWNFAYIGGITGNRGAIEMVDAIGRLRDKSVRLQVAGKFTTTRDEERVRGLGAWSRVEFHGWAGRREVARLLGNVRAGLVVLHPTANYPDSYPVKMFEYMAAGLPVIASDFALWREIVDGAGCGVLVDPLNPDAIADAMRWILAHPMEAEDMGRRGRWAVEKIYNWKPEARKLVDMYRRILGPDSMA